MMGACHEQSVTLRFDCAGCEKRIDAPLTMAGKRAACPHCRAIVEVPTLTMSSESQPTAIGAPAKRPGSVPAVPMAHQRAVLTAPQALRVTRPAPRLEPLETDPTEPAFQQFLYMQQAQRRGLIPPTTPKRQVPLVLEVYGILLMVLHAIMGTVNLFFYCIAGAVALSQHGVVALILIPGAIISTSFHVGLYDAGAKLRRGRKSGVIFLLVAGILAIGGSLLLIVFGLLIPEDQARGIAVIGLIGLLYSCVMFIPPVIVGLRTWNRLNR